MKRKSKAVFVIGCLLITSSLIMLAVLQVRVQYAKRTNMEIVQTMESILSDRREGVIAFETEKDMPVLELNGEDFIALLEIPSLSLKLPVSGMWDKKNVLSYPCRFCGTSYHGNLVIGGYDQPGQFDFLDEVSDQTMVKITDMTGQEFCYTVDCVERSDSAQAEILIDDKADLTLFVRDAQLLEYIIVRCVMRN